MNNSFTDLDRSSAQSAVNNMAVGMDFVATMSTLPPQKEDYGIPNAEIAQRVMKLTGGVRLTSRSAQRWHHCGINE